MHFNAIIHASDSPTFTKHVQLQFLLIMHFKCMQFIHALDSSTCTYHVQLRFLLIKAIYTCVGQSNLHHPNMCNYAFCISCIKLHAIYTCVGQSNLHLTYATTLLLFTLLFTASSKDFTFYQQEDWEILYQFCDRDLEPSASNYIHILP